MVGIYKPLNELPESHVARRLVFTHLECCRNCVGKEIPWPGRETEAFDQFWHSQLLQRDFTFSGFAYAFISFTLVMDEWIDRPPFVTENERRTIECLPLLRNLLCECYDAATQEKNGRVVDCIQRIRVFLDLWEDSIRLRLAEDGLKVPTPNVATDPWEKLFPGSPR